MEDVKHPATGGPAADYTAELGQLRETYEIVFAFLEQALCFEEAGRLGEALEMYYKILRYINAGLDIRTDLSHCVGPEWDEARTMQTKMASARETAHARIYELSSEKEPPKFAPPYCTAMVSSSAHGSSNNAEPSNRAIDSTSDEELPPTYLEALQSYSETESTTSAPLPLAAPGIPPNVAGLMTQASVRLLLKIPSGVQVFHIISNNEVQVESDPTELKIFTLSKAYQPISARTISWIQVGQFTYPLVPKKSPILKTGYGAYMFPELSTESENSTNVALILGADVSDTDRILLDDILREYAAFQEQAQIELNGEDSTLGQKVSDGIVSASEAISRSLVRGAQATSSALTYGAEKLREKLTPLDTAYVVDPRVQTGLKVALKTTHITCKLTGFVVSVVGDMAMTLGRRLAKTIAQPEVMGEMQNNAVLKEAVLIVGGGIIGFSKVFIGLENAGKVLARSITSNTVTIVHHKYGGDAGEAVENALFSVGNLALTANNVKNVGIRGIAKRTAKETGKCILQEYISTSTPNVIVEEPSSPPQPVS